MSQPEEIPLLRKMLEPRYSGINSQFRSMDLDDGFISVFR